MSDKEYVVYDFREAGAADDSANAFRTWIAKSAQAFVDHWAEIASTEATLSTSNLRTRSFEAAIEPAPVSHLCCTFHMGNPNTLSVWHFSQPHARMIVADLLGMSPTAELEDRPLTELEMVVVKSFVETLATSVEQGWLGAEPIQCNVMSLDDNPKRVRMCRARDLVITNQLTIKLERGEVQIDWIAQKQEMSDLLDLVADRRTDSGTGRTTEEVVRQLPIEVVGLLGQASVPMRKLTKLAVGDIIELKQRIDRPITVSVAGKPYFECWPGRIGESVGLEVSSMVGSTNATA